MIQFAALRYPLTGSPTMTPFMVRPQAALSRIRSPERCGQGGNISKNRFAMDETISESGPCDTVNLLAVASHAGRDAGELRSPCRGPDVFGGAS